MTDEYERPSPSFAPNARDFVEKVHAASRTSLATSRRRSRTTCSPGWATRSPPPMDYLPALTKGLGAISTSTNTGVKDIFMMMRDLGHADWGDMF